MKSLREIFPQRCNLRSFLLLRASPQRLATQSRYNLQLRIKYTTFGQVRTSYLPNEILWGYRFEHSCVAYDQKAAKYVVSVNNLNRVLADNMTPR